MRTFLLSLVLLPILLQHSSRTEAQGVGDSSVQSLLGKDWQCLLMPSELYGPGTVFAVTNETKKYLGRLNAKDGYVVERGSAALGTLTDTRDYGGRVSVNLLRRIIRNGGAELDAAAKNGRFVSAAYSVSEYVVTPQASVRHVRAWMSRNVEPDRGVRYFYVREAIKASALLHRGI